MQHEVGPQPLKCKGIGKGAILCFLWQPKLLDVWGRLVVGSFESTVIASPEGIPYSGTIPIKQKDCFVAPLPAMTLFFKRSHYPPVTSLVNLRISDILNKMFSAEHAFRAEREHLPIAGSSLKSIHCIGVMTTFLKSSETMPLFK